MNQWNLGDTPQFKHDCTNCQFLGRGSGPYPDIRRYDHDWYICVRKSELWDSSIVARYGDDGPDYSSLPMDIALMLNERGSFEIPASIMTNINMIKGLKTASTENQ